MSLVVHLPCLYITKYLRLQVIAYVSDVMDVGSNVDMANFTMQDVESNIVRCPDQEAAQKMIDGEAGLLNAGTERTG